MKIIEPGHVYSLDSLDGAEPVTLTFVNREPGHEHAGTQTQDVLRALIDRTYHCHNCLPHSLNAHIIYHLRMALVYHEMRALERRAQKGLYYPEEIATGFDGHFHLQHKHADPLAASKDNLTNVTDEKVCMYREYNTDGRI